MSYNSFPGQEPPHDDVVVEVQPLNPTDLPRGATRGAATDVKSRFWTTYAREADEYDAEFLERYMSDMDIVLIFAGLFSGVCTGFLAAQFPSLGADQAVITNQLLQEILNTLNNNNTHSGQTISVASPPESTQIWSQSLGYASLCASLLAALLAMLGKQWLSNFKRIGRGTIDARGRRRQQKLDALHRWHLEAVLETLPVLLQMSLFLFAIALAAVIWSRKQIVGSVIVAMTTCGIALYVSIIISSLVSSESPFQTPLTRLLRSIGRWLPNFSSSLDGRRDCAASFFRALLYIPLSIRMTFNEMSAILVPKSIPPPGSQSIEVLNAPSVKWMLETSDDPDIIATAATLVPEVEWPIKLDASTMLAQLRDTFLSCFEDTQYGQPKLASRSRERAIACGKAFVHMYIERRCVQGRPTLPHGTYSSEPHSGPSPRPVDFQWLLWVRHDDPELSFICDLLLELVLDVGMVTPLSLRATKIPDSFLEWLSHSLPQCLVQPQYAKFWRRRTLDALTRLLVSPLPSSSVLANCLMAAGLILGQSVDTHDLLVVDKSLSVKSLLASLLQKMQSVIGKDVIRLEQRDSDSMYSLALLGPLSVILQDEEFQQIAHDCDTPDWTQKLCQSLVQSVLSQPNRRKPRERVWSSARAALHLSVASSNIGSNDQGATWDPQRVRNHHPQPTPDCDWLIDFVDHHHRMLDVHALSDGFRVMGTRNDVAQPSKLSAYVNALVFGLGTDQPLDLRRAALRAAHAGRREFASFGPETMSGRLRSRLSSALRWVVQAELGNAEADIELVGRHDLRYLQIMLAFSSSMHWMHELCAGGHLRTCLSIARDLETFKFFLTDQLAVYLLATIWLLRTHPTNRDLATDLELSDDLYRWLFNSAWNFAAKSHRLPTFSDFRVQDVIHPLEQFTKQRIGQDPGMETEELQARMARTFQHLTERTSSAK